MFQFLIILRIDYTINSSISLICGSEVHVIKILVKIEGLGLLLVATILYTGFLVLTDPLFEEVGLTL